MNEITKREFIQAVVSTGVVSLAGCSSSNTPETTESETPEDTHSAPGGTGPEDRAQTSDEVSTEIRRSTETQNRASSGTQTQTDPRSKYSESEESEAELGVQGDYNRYSDMWIEWETQDHLNSTNEVSERTYEPETAAELIYNINARWDSNNYETVYLSIRDYDGYHTAVTVGHVTTDGESDSGTHDIFSSGEVQVFFDKYVTGADDVSDNFALELLEYIE